MVLVTTSTERLPRGALRPRFLLRVVRENLARSLPRVVCRGDPLAQKPAKHVLPPHVDGPIPRSKPCEVATTNGRTEAARRKAELTRGLIDGH
jgi:hypothetical protein